MEAKTKLHSCSLENLTIHVEVDGVDFKRSLSDDLQVDEESINRWLKEQPIKIAYWAIWAGRAETAKLTLKHQVDRAEAIAFMSERKKIYEQFKEDFRNYFLLSKDEQKFTPKPKEPTADVYKHATTLNKDLQEAIDNHVKAEEVVKYLRAAVQAINEMRSTLISLAANMRKELTSYDNVIMPQQTNVNQQIAQANRRIANKFNPDDPTGYITSENAAAVNSVESVNKATTEQKFDTTIVKMEPVNSAGIVNNPDANGKIWENNSPLNKDQAVQKTLKKILKEKT